MPFSTFCFNSSYRFFWRKRRVDKRVWRRWRNACFLVSSHRLLHSPVLKASMGFTLRGSQCMPGPSIRDCTTCVLALSALPLPIGQPSARKRGYCIIFSRFCNILSFVPKVGQLEAGAQKVRILHHLFTLLQVMGCLQKRKKMMQY